MHIIGWIITIVLLWLYIYFNCNPHTMSKYWRTKIFYPESTYRVLKTEKTNWHHAPYHLVDVNQLEYPVVLKPNFKSGANNNVSVCNSMEEVKGYVANFDYSFDDFIIVQTLFSGKEMTIMYIKYPGCTGKIVSAVEAEATCDDPTLGPRFCGRTAGTITFIDRKDWLNDTNKRKFISLFENIPDLNVARADIFVKDEAAFKRGEILEVIEVNGRQSYEMPVGRTVHPNEQRKFSDLLHVICRNTTIGFMNVLQANGRNVGEFISILPKIIGIAIYKPQKITELPFREFMTVK